MRSLSLTTYLLVGLVFIVFGCGDKDKYHSRSSRSYGNYILSPSRPSPAGKIAHDLPDSLLSDIVPDGNFNIRVRMSKEFDQMWKRENNHILGRALDKWESVILERPTNDTPLSGQDLGRQINWAKFTEPDSVYFGGYELEILMDYDPNGLGFAGASALVIPNGNGLYLPISSMTVGKQFFELIENGRLNDELLYQVLLHEFGHAIGFGSFASKIAPWEREIGGRFGRYCVWNGPNALRAWNNILGINPPTLSTIALEIDCGHWDYQDSNWKTVHDAMFYSMSNSTPHLSPVTIGYFQDLGFKVNYDNADVKKKLNWGVKPAGKALKFNLNIVCDGHTLEVIH